MRKSAIFWSLIITIPLLVGLVIYLVFKPSAFISRLFFDLLGQQPLIIQTPKCWFWNFIRFYLCDLLWAFSFTAVLQLVLGSGQIHTLLSLLSLLSLLICIIAGVAIELLQQQGIISGTFDIWDLLVESIGSILSLITTTYKRRKQNEKQSS